MSEATTIHEVYPYLRVKNAAAAIDFYQAVFGAVEIFRLAEPSGRIGHAELKLGSAILMVSDEYPEYGILGPQTTARIGSAIHLHVDDVDALTEKARLAGSTVLMEPTDQFYGERTAVIKDPFLHEWMIGAQIEQVSPEEMQRRFNAMFETNS